MDIVEHLYYPMTRGKDRLDLGSERAFELLRGFGDDFCDTPDLAPHVLQIVPGLWLCQHPSQAVLGDRSLMHLGDPSLAGLRSRSRVLVGQPLLGEDKTSKVRLAQQICVANKPRIEFSLGPQVQFHSRLEAVEPLLICGREGASCP
ncbi:MAG: hypothetical protein EOP24_42590 [Hyphomicrobiales bacterium]|nr:MAG: hypothetical protein EOP24_42590 [Hyphomicrobiales bacterium]